MNDIHINNGYYRLRPATMDEIPVIWEIILQAKAQMYREGKHQWAQGMGLRAGTGKEHFGSERIR